jgi:hypothetical protein
MLVWDGRKQKTGDIRRGGGGGGGCYSQPKERQ